MADADVRIGIKTEYDPSGSQASARDLEALKGSAGEVAEASKRAADATKNISGGVEAARGAFDRLRDAAGGVGRVVGTFRNLIGGFGVVSIVMSAVNAYNAWKAKADEVRKSHEDLAKAISESARNDALKAAVDGYQRLAASIREAAQAQADLTSRVDATVKAQRERAEAEAKAETARKIANVAANDPDRDRKIAEIRRESAYNSAWNSAVDKQADANARADDLDRQAAADDEAAAKVKASVEELAKKLAETEAAAEDARRRSEADNEKDETGQREVSTVMHTYAGSYVQTSYVDDPSAPKVRTKEGDDVRKEALAEARSKASEADAIRQRLDADRKQYDELVGGAENKRHDANALRENSAAVASAEKEAAIAERTAAENEAAAKDLKEAAERQKEAARAAAELERERRQEEMESIREQMHTLKKSSDETDYATKATDRIAQMGGFASAGAATVSGMPSLDKNYEALRQQQRTLENQLKTLQAIEKNTKSSGAGLFQ